MGEKTAGVGHFAIPTAPAAGTSCTSGAANVFTTTYVQLSAAAPAALYITGIHVEKAAASAATYAVVQLATGLAAAETIVGQYLVPLATGSTVALGYRRIYPPIPVANGIRIACKTADSVGAQASLITLECINQSNVVDDGVPVGSVAGLTAANLDVAVSTRMATYAQPTGFLAATFPATVASTTNITAGTITTVTNLTNAPTAGDFTAVMKAAITVAATAATPVVALPAIPANWITAAGIAAGALSGKGDWLLASGYTVPPTAAAIRAEIDANSAGLAAIFARTDVATSSRLATAGYTLPDNAGVAAIKAKTDSLAFTVAGKLDSNITAVNGLPMAGTGTLVDPWHA